MKVLLIRLAPWLVLTCGFALLAAADRYLAGTTYGIRADTLEVDDVRRVLPLSAPYVHPVLYTHVQGLEALPTPEAKRVFISIVLPSVLVARHEIDMVRARLIRLDRSRSWRQADSAFYETVCHRYKATGIKELLKRVGTVPTSLVLAQAAVESGWGQSRIFLEGNNLFGIWSFDPEEPRIAAGETRGKRTIWLRSYANMSESIADYFDLLSTSHAFETLRTARLTTDDPWSLLPHLRKFSELRGAYTRKLKIVMQQNNLTQYDSYELDPEYVFEQ